MLALLAAVAALPTASLPAVVVGQSVQGRPITARRIGDPSSARKVLVVGAIHGDEGAGRAIVRALASEGAAGAADIWLVSTVNPDGSRRGTRTNARGVDLNRNFSRGWRANAGGRLDYAGRRPFSEPESRAVRRLVLRLRPRVTISFHQPWGQVLAPCRGVAALQRRYARIARLPVKRCRGSTLPGHGDALAEARPPGHGRVRRRARSRAPDGGRSAPPCTRRARRCFPRPRAQLIVSDAGAARKSGPYRELGRCRYPTLRQATPSVTGWVRVRRLGPGYQEAAEGPLQVWMPCPD